MAEKISKRQLAIELIEQNFCMINGILSKEEAKKFKDHDFAAYLVHSLKRLDQYEKQNKYDGKKPSDTNPNEDITIFVTSDISEEDICALIHLKSEKPWGTMYISVNNIERYELLHFIKDGDVYDLHTHTDQSHYKCNAMTIAQIVYADIHK